MSTVLKDVNGNVSSKRVAGFVLMFLALAGGLTGSLLGNQMLVDFSKWVIVTGAGALMAGVAERKA